MKKSRGLFLFKRGGIFGVRVSLRFFFSFRLNKNNPRDFFTYQWLDKFRRCWYKICYHNPSKNILIFRWIITNFQKVVCFEQFLWAWYNLFASFFSFGCYVQNLFFHLLVHILSCYLVWYLFEVFQFYARTSFPLKKVLLEKSGAHFRLIKQMKYEKLFLAMDYIAWHWI